MAKGLIDRGYQPRIVTSEVYREKLDREGIDFIAAPPDLSDVEDESEMMRKAMDRFGGTRYVIQDLVLPHLKRNHQILYDATSDADLLISHPLTFAVPIVAEQRRLPWIGTSLQPMVMLSAYDPPIFGQMPWLGRLPRAQVSPSALVDDEIACPQTVGGTHRTTSDRCGALEIEEESTARWNVLRGRQSRYVLTTLCRATTRLAKQDAGHWISFS